MGGKFLEYSKRLALPLILAGFLLLTIPQIHKLAVTDEYVYYQGMAALADNSTMYPSKGEGRASDGDLIGAYAHMPFYVWSSSLFLKIFGVKTSVARLVPIICGFISLLLVWKILGRFGRYKQILLTGLLAVHPLFVQNSVLLDIDGSVLSLFLLLTLYWHLQERIWLMIISLSIAFFSKLTTGFIIIAVIMVYELLKGNKKAIFKYPAVLLASLLMSFLMNLWFANAYNLNWKYPYEQFVVAVIVPGLTNQPTISSKLMIIGMNAIELLTWFNVVFLALVGYQVVIRIKSYIKNRKIESQDLFMMTGIIVFLFYALIFPPTFGFPKYYQIAIVTMVIGLAGMDIMFKNWIGLAATALFTAVFLQDRVLHQVIYLAMPLTEFLKQQAAVIISFLLGLIFMKKTKEGITRPAVPILLVFFLVVDIFILFSPNVGYFYGEQGMRKTVEFIRENTDTADIIIAPLDVAHQSGRRFHGFEGYDNDLRREIFHEDAQNKGYKFIVLRKKYYRYHPELKAFLDANTVLVQDFGSFQIRRP